MDSRKPLYRHSLKEAVRHEEKDLWRESYKINCDCARAIERSIAENYDGKKLGPDLAEPIIQQYGFNRVNWVLANTVQQKKKMAASPRKTGNGQKPYRFPRRSITGSLK